MNLKRLKYLKLLCAIALVFASGFAFHKYKFFPYGQIKTAAKSIKALFSRDTTDPEAAKSGMYSQTPGSADLIKSIDTALLPLEARGVQISALLSFPKSGGGIAVIHEAVIIADWMGGVYCFEKGKIRKLAFPLLPNNIDDYAKHFPPLTPAFRVHDIEYVASVKSLAVAHEYFDKEGGTTRLVVSLIGIDDQTFAPNGPYKTVFQGDLLTVKTQHGIAGGGRLLARGPKLIVTTGDYNQDNVMEVSEKEAQVPGSTFGKIFEIDLVSEQRRMISMGHRNPQGILVTDNGEVYSTEHGPAGGDELNQITEGGNYGWPEVTLGTDYGAYDWPNAKYPGEHQGYTMPVFAWVPSIAVGNLIQVKGFDRRWDGDLLVASLKASSLFRMRMDNHRVVYSEPIWIGDRIRDLAQMPDGTLVLWTDDAKLWFVRVDAPKLKDNKRALDIVLPPIMTACMSCHHFGETNPSHLGPTLSGLIGRKVASDNFARYSDGLKKAGGDWSKERLREFLLNPPAFASGTLMPKMELSADNVNNILGYLEQAGTVKKEEPVR